MLLVYCFVPGMLLTACLAEHRDAGPADRKVGVAFLFDKDP